MRSKNTLVTDRILDGTLPNTLIVLVEYTSFCKIFPFAVRNYSILWSFEHPLGIFWVIRRTENFFNIEHVFTENICRMLLPSKI